LGRHALIAVFLLLSAAPLTAAADPALSEPRYLTLSAADGTRLSLGLHSRATPTARLLLVAPGFGQRAGTETMRFIAGLLTPTCDVAVLDFRGTGGSFGFYSFGEDEAQDLQAALAWAQARYKGVDLLGLSMGGYIGVRCAVEGPLRPQRLLIASAPTWVEEVASSFGIFAHPFDQAWNQHRPVAHGSVDPFFRWGSVFGPKPKADAIAKDLTVPLHVLVGGQDHLVFPSLTRRIFDAAPEPKTWTLWPEGGHAEHLALEDPPGFAAWVRAGLQSPLKQAIKEKR
jgi:pimeloyl-ACP methyl ester carboxylesterase